MAKLTTFGKYLKQAALHPDEVARKLKVTRQYVFMLMNGAASPGLSLAGQIERLTKGKVPMRAWL